MEFALKNQNATSAILSVTIQEADYSALVEKQLKNFRQKANNAIYSEPNNTKS